MGTNLPEDLRLGIVTGTTAFRDEAGQLWVNHSIGRLCEAIKHQVPKTRICLPVLPALQPNHNHILQFERTSVVDLPPLRTTIQAQRYSWQTRQIIRRFAESVDVLFMRLPIQIPWAVTKLPKPKLLHVVSNPREVIDSSSDYRGIKKWLAQRFADHSERTMKQMVAEPYTRTCTNGAEMWQRLGCRNGRIVVSSCLMSGEIEPRTDFALHAPPRLLFVGYIRPEKGVEVLLDAFEELRRLRPLKLTLVGGGDRVTGVESRIYKRITHSPFKADIEHCGMLSFDEQLFQMFRSHDICVLPSLSEGTPRTLVEARAFGCPIVATRVGGIPASVTDGKDGLLVEAGDSRQLVVAVCQILDDERLRISLIRNGIDWAREHTLEAFANELLVEISQLLLEIPQSATA